MARKTEALFVATVFHQAPAIDGVAQLSVVGSVSGTHDECWKQAKEMTRFPVIQFKEVNHVTH